MDCVKQIDILIVDGPHPISLSTGTSVLPGSRACQPLAWNYTLGCPGSKAFGLTLELTITLLALQLAESLGRHWDLLASITA